MQSYLLNNLDKDDTDKLNKQFTKKDLSYISDIIESLANHETASGAEVVPAVEGKDLILMLSFPEYDVESAYCKIIKDKGQIIIYPYQEEKDKTCEKIICGDFSYIEIADKIRDYLESIEPDYGNIEDAVKRAVKNKSRNVFVSQTFIDSLKDNIKTRNDADRVYTAIVSKWFELTDDGVDNWLGNKHGVPIPCENGKLIYRKRSPKGSNVSRINRYLVCRGNQIDSRQDISSKDIILLAYLGGDKHKSDAYIPYANAIANRLESIGRFELTIEHGTENIGEAIYKVVLPKTNIKNGNTNLNNKRKRIAMLDANQYIKLSDNIMIHPPCLVYGSAGTGKTLLSEELYEKKVRENPQNRVLYLTYMQRLKNQVEGDIELRSLPPNNGEIKTFDELLRDISPRAFKGYRGREDFNQWASDYIYRNKIKYKLVADTKEMAIDIMYIFFRSHSSTDAMRYKGTFFAQVSSEKGMQDEAKEIVWDVCTHYEQNLINNNRFSDNSAAKELPKAKVRYDCIIVDEIQDLTKTQVECIIELLSNEGKYYDSRGRLISNPNFFAFGDDNQTINPTLMRLSNVDEILYAKFKKNNKNPIILKESYRSTEYLIKYINHINRKRIDVIGKDSDYNDGKQKSKIGYSFGNESCMPMFVNDPEIIHKGFEDKNIFLNNNVKIIVTGKDEYKRLIDRYEWLDNTGKNKKDRPYDEKNLYTIEETKGGEWDIVILYDFFTSHSKIWKFFVDSLENPESKSLRSTIYRMYFSRFYVGLTRASKKVIIAESKELDPKIKEYFIPKSIFDNNHETQIFTEVADYSDFRNFFADNYTHDVWFDKAMEMYEFSDYEMALDYISKAQRSLENIFSANDRNSIEMYMSLLEKYTAWRKLIDPDSGKESINDILEYGLTYVDNRVLDLVYKKMNQPERASLILGDKSEDPEAAILQCENLISNNELMDAEINYLSLDVIKAYRSIISERIKEW